MNIFLPFLLSLTLNLGVSVVNQNPTLVKEFNQGIKLSANAKNTLNLDFSLNSSDFKNINSFGLAFNFPTGLNIGIGHFDTNKVLFHKASPGLSTLSQSVITSTLSAKNPFTVPSFDSSSKTFAVGFSIYKKHFDFGIIVDEFVDFFPTRFSLNAGFISKLQKIDLLNEATFVLFEYSECQNQNTWFTQKKFVPKTYIPLFILHNSVSIPFSKATLKIANEFRIQDSPFSSLLICNTGEMELKTKRFQLDFGILAGDFEFITANSKFLSEPLKIKLNSVFFFDNANVGLYYFYKLKNTELFNELMFKSDFLFGDVKLDYSITLEEFNFPLELKKLNIKSEFTGKYKNFSLELEDKAQNLQTSVTTSFAKKNYSFSAKTTIKDYAFSTQNVEFSLDFAKLKIKNTLECKLNSKENWAITYEITGTLKIDK